MPPRKPGKSATHHSALAESRGNAINYFGPEYYQLYENGLLPAEQTRAEATFLLKILKPAPGTRWLDVPCGYGRHLIELEKLRPRLALVGGDLNPEYLDLARTRSSANLVRLNLLRLPFRSGVFSIATCLLNSFGYFGSPGDRLILKEFARVLGPRGRLVLDLPNRRALLTVIRRQPIIRYFSGDYDVIEKFSWNAQGQAIINETIWSTGRKKRRSGYTLRLYTPTQIGRMLNSAGFQIVSTHGDFTGAPFNADSDRLLLIAVRH